jgi:hypothetical protein
MMPRQAVTTIGPLWVCAARRGRIAGAGVQRGLDTIGSGRRCPMKRYGRTSSRRRGIRGGAASKRAAESRARALLPIIRTLMEAGYVSQHALTDELNRRGIAANPGRKWSSIARMLRRLGLSTNGKTDTVLAHRPAADARAEKLASIVQEFRAGARLLSELSLARLTNGGFQPHGAA